MERPSRRLLLLLLFLCENSVESAQRAQPGPRRDHTVKGYRKEQNRTIRSEDQNKIVAMWLVFRAFEAMMRMDRLS